MKHTMIQLPGFEGVDDGAGFHIEPGDYAMKCVGASQKEAQSSGKPMIVFFFMGIEGKARGKQFKFYCSLKQEALWKLRMTLTTLGLPTPNDPSELDPDDVVDIEVVGTVEDNLYEGNTYSRLIAIAVSDSIKEPPKLGESEVREMSADELDDVVEKYGFDIDLSDHKTASKKAAAVLAELEAAGMLEADNGRKARIDFSKIAEARLAANEVQAMNQDELEDVVDKYDLNVDLSSHRTLSRMANAVIAELRRAKMLDG
jgi:hypothetical protein